MTIFVTNFQTFEWEVTDELVDLFETSGMSYQDLIDEYFCPTDLSVDQTNDDYYKFDEVIL